MAVPVQPNPDALANLLQTQPQGQALQAQPLIHDQLQVLDQQGQGQQAPMDAVVAQAQVGEVFC